MAPPLPPYTVTRKRVKNIRVSVKSPDGEVRVSAPWHASDRFIADFVASKADWIAKHQTRIVAQPRPIVAGPDAERLRKDLKEAIAPLVHFWAPRMGVPTPEYSVRRMTTRWGTCNTKTRRITLNLELANRRPEALEYVVVHELAHLIERGHNPKFYAVLDQHLPDWRQRKRALDGRDL